jgi:excisionase family DNA binding protein
MRERLLRVQTVARLLDVPESTVYGLVRRKLLPAVKVGRHIRFSEPRMREFINRGGTKHAENGSIKGSSAGSGSRNAKKTTDVSLNIC